MWSIFFILHKLKIWLLKSKLCLSGNTDQFLKAHLFFKNIYLLKIIFLNIILHCQDVGWVFGNSEDFFSCESYSFYQ